MATADSSPGGGGRLLVVVELGSNSWHLVAVRWNGRTLEPVEHVVETVRLPESLLADNRIDERKTAAVGAIADRFRSILATLGPVSVAAIATGTLRTAVNGRDLAEDLGRRLGVRVKVLSERDEALLAYTGALAFRSIDANSTERVLFADIGGATCQFVTGRGLTVNWYGAMAAGCVSVSREFFADGDCDPERFASAVSRLKERMEQACPRLGERAWPHAVATGGSATSIDYVLKARRLGGRHVTAASLNRLVGTVTADGNAAQVGEGLLTADRQRVFAGGLALTVAWVEVARIDRLTVRSAGVREGALVHLIRDRSGRAPS
jgi:exopolyphosphatase/guanosine-5'-triphosphate,3'-diphosphate pyrophosphatase